MEPTAALYYPGAEPVWWIDGEFSADGRHFAATVQTVNWPMDRASRRATRWSGTYRSPSTAPVRVSIGTDCPGAGAQPGRPHFVHRLAARRVRRGVGDEIWTKDVTTFYAGLDVHADGSLLAVVAEEPGACAQNALLVGPPPARRSASCVARGTRPATSEFSPDGTLVGSVSSDGELVVWETATGRLLERWQTFDQQGIGFGPDNDLVHGGGRDSMLRTWDLSMQDTYLHQVTQVGDSSPYAHADVSPDGERVAYRWIDDAGTGWVRFVDTATGDATTPAKLPTQLFAWSLGSWRPDGQQYVGWCIMDCEEHGVLTVHDATTGEVVDKVDMLDDEDIVLGDLHG